VEELVSEGEIEEVLGIATAPEGSRFIVKFTDQRVCQLSKEKMKEMSTEQRTMLFRFLKDNHQHFCHNEADHPDDDDDTEVEEIASQQLPSTSKQARTPKSNKTKRKVKPRK